MSKEQRPVIASEKYGLPMTKEFASDPIPCLALIPVNKKMAFVRPSSQCFHLCVHILATGCAPLLMLFARKWVLIIHSELY